LKDSSVLADMAFLQLDSYISPENWSDLHENSVIDVSLDQEVSVDGWQLSGKYPDLIHLCGGLRSPSVLV